MSLKLKTKQIKITREQATKLARELKKELQKDEKKPYGVYLLVNEQGKFIIGVSAKLGYGNLQGVSNYELIMPVNWLTYKKNGVTTQRQLEEIIYKEGNKALKEKYVDDARQEIMDTYLYEWARNGKSQKGIQVYVYASLYNDRERHTIYRGSLNDDALISINIWLSEEMDRVLSGVNEPITYTYIGVNEIRNEVADGTTKFSVAQIRNHGTIEFVLGEERDGKFKRLELYNEDN